MKIIYNGNFTNNIHCPNWYRLRIGGFAGDALPTAKLLASASGCLITHPNVMNGGTLSEKDQNIFYVEGLV